MSRYRPDPRYSEGNLPYREPPAQRWDTDRFAREREIRAPPVIDQRPPYADFPPRRAPVYEDQRYYEEDRYGPRGTTQRKYFEETDYYDPRGQRGQMVPYAPERPARPEPPPRPGLLRRQSSLDTFDRQPARRYRDYDDDYVPQRAPPPRELIPVPVPSPRRQPRYDDRYYDDVRVQDPDLYGDDGFREYREREWVSRRRRNSSPSPDRRTMREEFFEEVKEEKEVKQYPRRGKTRMPKRLVHTKVLYDLGYPYYEEVESTIPLLTPTMSLLKCYRMSVLSSLRRLLARKTSMKFSPKVKNIVNVKVSMIQPSPDRLLIDFSLHYPAH